MRIGPILRAALLPLELMGCSSSDRDWHGFAIGRKSPSDARLDPLNSESHLVQLRGNVGFPWQSARARLDRGGAVTAVTLTTRCCGDMPMMDRSPTPEEWEEVTRQERAVPDRFRDRTPPPPVRNVDWVRQPRTISVGDMARYARAAIREVAGKLGSATMAGWRAGSASRFGQRSALSNDRAFEARWLRSGRTIAILTADRDLICLSVVSPDVPHPPLEGACEGVRMDCPVSWYPGDRTSTDASRAILLPPIVATPGMQEPPCRPD